MKTCGFSTLDVEIIKLNHVSQVITQHFNFAHPNHIRDRGNAHFFSLVDSMHISIPTLALFRYLAIGTAGVLYPAVLQHFPAVALLPPIDLAQFQLRPPAHRFSGLRRIWLYVDIRLRSKIERGLPLSLTSWLTRKLRSPVAVGCRVQRRFSLFSTSFYVRLRIFHNYIFINVGFSYCLLRDL